MKETILIVEDEMPLVTLLRYNLEREGFAALDAQDGEEALNIAREQKPDLVLLDWMLPLMSGIEVCRQLRRNPQTREIPIVMLTARGEEGDKLRGLDSGADDYVNKPFSPSELIARIRAVLRRAKPPRWPRGASRADRVPPATLFAGASGAGVLARAASEWRLGPRCLCRAAHGRRPCPPAAQGPERARRHGPHPHRPLRRLRARCAEGVSLPA